MQVKMTVRSNNLWHKEFIFYLPNDLHQLQHNINSKPPKHTRGRWVSKSTPFFYHSIDEVQPCKQIIETVFASSMLLAYKASTNILDQILQTLSHKWILQAMSSKVTVIPKQADIAKCPMLFWAT